MGLEGRTKTLGWKLQEGRFKLMGKNSDNQNHLAMAGLSERSGGSVSQCSRPSLNGHFSQTLQGGLLSQLNRDLCPEVQC